MNDQYDAVILGAGSWGTALALHLARENRSVCLWDRDPKKVALMQSKRVNAGYLPDFPFPKALSVEADLSVALSGSTCWIIAVPSSGFVDCLSLLSPYMRPDIQLAWVSKGLDPETHRPLDERVATCFPGHALAVLSGPSLAAEVAADLPTAMVVAGTDEVFNQYLQQLFHCGSCRIYHNADFTGVELCGALKNVLAIAVGLSDGLSFGANARAALITRGLVEMGRLCEALGGDASTVSGLAGLGDLLLTCTDDRSRNRRFGLALGAGLTVAEALDQIGQAVEGYQNCQHAHKLAKNLGISAPITEQVYRVTAGLCTAKEAADELLGRQAGDET